MNLDSHHLAQVLARPRRRVLDVGCGDGTVAQMLHDVGCDVVGLDIAEEAVEAMEERGMSAHLIDLDVDKLDDVLGDGEEFDVIVCLDVLEHTRRPAAVLSALLDRLVADGDVIISLPNVTHADVRLALLSGEFRYRDEGLLDATHLRFFDRAGVEDLLNDCGLAMRELHPVRYPLGGTELAIDVAAVPDDIRLMLDADETAEIYQWVMRAQRRDEETPPAPMQHLLVELEKTAEAQHNAEAYAERLAGEFGSLQRALHELEVHSAKIEDELGAVSADRDLVRAAGESAAADLREEIDLLQREVEAKDDVVALMAEEQAALEARLAEVESHAATSIAALAAEVEALRGGLAAIENRRAYRMVNGAVARALRVPGVGRVLSRRAGS